MKKRNLLFVVALLIVFAVPVFADSLESVRVIKFWDDTDDLIVQRASGEKLLLQHNRMCSTMSTEFPMQILWSGEKVAQAKVAANELCTVYNFGPYSSDLIISKRIPSSNSLTKEHLAEVDWQGNRYQIDYSVGCTYLRDFVGKTAYVYTPQNNLEGATLYLPKNRGECEISSATLLQALENPSTKLESPLKNFGYTAENNQIYFTWDKFPENEKWLVLIAHSKFQMNPDDYTLEQMPNLKYARTNSLRILQLMNNQPYYFYITARNADGELAPWKEIPITPIQTAKRIINNVDSEPFEIVMTETDSSYHLTWPDMSENSRKYMIMIYVDGNREFFNLTNGAENFFDFEKKPEWSASRFRMTVRSIPIKATGIKYFDSIFWRKG